MKTGNKNDVRLGGGGERVKEKEKLSAYTYI